MLGPHECSYPPACQDLLLHNVFSQAKSRKLALPGFPDFTSALEDMNRIQSSALKDTSYQYKVTVPLSGELIILNSHSKNYQESPTFAAEFLKIQQDHDKEFNKSHRAAGDTPDAAQVKSPKPDRLKLCKEFESIEAFKAKYKEPFGLN